MIDSDLLIEVDDEKTINASNIEGTMYRTGSLGGNSLNVRLTNQTASTSPSVGAGLTSSFNATLSTNPPVTMSPQMLFSVYVDNDNDLDWLWPDGANLTSSNRPRINWSLSEAYSNPNSGSYTWSFAIKNESSSAQVYYFKLRVLMPIVRA